MVAQNSLFAKSNYQDFFTHFQHNYGEVGVSIQIPVVTGSGSKGLASQAQAEIMQLRTQMNQTRNRIELDTQKSFQEVQKASTASELAKLDRVDDAP